MLDAYLVDTGVFLRWYVEQDGFEQALALQGAFLAEDVELETVDFVRVELANALRVHGLLPGRLTREQYLLAVREIDDLGVIVHETDVDALQRAAALAADRSLRIFDALVVERAIERDLPLLTTDAALIRSVDDLLPTELLRNLRRW